jgi:hypothetical protein
LKTRESAAAGTTYQKARRGEQRRLELLVGRCHVGFPPGETMTRIVWREMSVMFSISL